MPPTHPDDTTDATGTDTATTETGHDTATADEPLLVVDDLRTSFDTAEGTVQAVSDVSFHVERGETVCIVGESGSGKSVTSESLTRLVPTPPGTIEAGDIRFDGESLPEMSEAELHDLRGNRIAHIFQNPQNALNPVYTIGWQLVEAIQLHDDVSDAKARERAVRLLDQVGIPEATARFDDYPHEFSGGMRQRVMIAMALSSDPDLLIADEPTTALDVTIQSQILQLLMDLQDDFGMSIIFITHDLSVVAEIADRVLVMYAGKLMEEGSVYDIFDAPAHPYTQALLQCLPGRGDGMSSIDGQLPDATDPPAGCRFHPRCPYATDACKDGPQPSLGHLPDDPAGTDSSHRVSCLAYPATNRRPEETLTPDTDANKTTFEFPQSYTPAGPAEQPATSDDQSPEDTPDGA